MTACDWLAVTQSLRQAGTVPITKEPPEVWAQRGQAQPGCHAASGPGIPRPTQGEKTPR